MSQIFNGLFRSCWVQDLMIQNLKKSIAVDQIVDYINLQGVN